MHAFAIPPHLVHASAPLVDVPLVGVLQNPYDFQRLVEENGNSREGRQRHGRGGGHLQQQRARRDGKHQNNKYHAARRAQEQKEKEEDAVSSEAGGVGAEAPKRRTKQAPVRRERLSSRQAKKTKQRIHSGAGDT